jgi:hypothetical protein
VIAEGENLGDDRGFIEVTEGGDDCTESDGVGLRVEHGSEYGERFVGEESGLTLGSMAELGQDIGAASTLEWLFRSAPDNGFFEDLARAGGAKRVDCVPGFVVVVVTLECLREELVDSRGRHGCQCSSGEGGVR